MLLAVMIVGATPVALRAQVTAPPPAAVPVDSAKLVLGKQIAAKLVPPGVYREMMRGTLDQMMAGMTGQMMDIPIKQLAGMSGVVPPEKLKALGPGTLREIALVLDPAFEERTRVSTKVMMDGMIDLVSQSEPLLRDGLGEAYARRFTTEQLSDLLAFLNTPSGAAYARQSMLVTTDPAVISRMQALIPTMMKAMPDLIKRVQAATAGLPKPRDLASLTPAEKTKLATMLGVDPATLK